MQKFAGLGTHLVKVVDGGATGCNILQLAALHQTRQFSNLAMVIRPTFTLISSGNFAISKRLKLLGIADAKKKGVFVQSKMSVFDTVAGKVLDKLYAVTRSTGQTHHGPEYTIVAANILLDHMGLWGTTS